MGTTLRPAEFVAALRDADSVETGENLVLREMRYIRSFRTTPGSARNAFTAYRSAVRQSDLPSHIVELVLSELHVTPDEQKDLTKANAKKTDARQYGGLRPIRDFRAYIRLGEDLLEARSYLDNVIGMAILTGRRTGEILSTAEFETVSGKTHTVLFTGQLKTKDRGVRGDVGPYEIPTLTAAPAVIEALARLRAAKPQYVGDPKRAHDAASRDIGRRVRRHVVGHLGSPEKTTPHDLRKAYAAVAFHIMSKRDRTKDKPAFLSRILGHEDLLSASMAYHGYFLED